MRCKSYLIYMILAGALSFSGCKEDDEPMEPIHSIIYTLDGRTVKLGDPFPIAIDLLEDGQVDFTIFVELTANNQGDRLYVGMNPIGANLIKSGPPIDENFLSMGFLVAEIPDSLIGFTVRQNQQWTPEFGALVIRNTFTNGDVSYEGNWIDSEQIVGIQHKAGPSVYFGWLRIGFDTSTEIVTLVDYAYNSLSNQSIKAGGISN